MTKASDNPFPSVLITESSTPSSPAAGKQRLYIDSTAHTLKRVNSSGTITSLETTSGVPSGTSFPGSPSTNDLYFRTDYGLVFYYDGTRWVTHLMRAVAHVTTTNITTTTETSRFGLQAPVGTNIYLVSWNATFLVSGGTALSGSHKWVITSQKYPSNTTMGGSHTINSGASDAWRSDTASTIGELLGTDYLISMGGTKTGTPGALYYYATINYRIVAT